MDRPVRKQGDLGIGREAEGDYSGVMDQVVDKSRKWVDFVTENGL